MSVDMRKTIKKYILKALNKSRTKSMYRLNLILEIKVHCYAITLQNFNSVLDELIEENEIEVAENLIKISNKKFLEQVIPI